MVDIKFDVVLVLELNQIHINHKNRPLRFLLYLPIHVLLLTCLKETCSMYVRANKLIDKLMLCWTEGMWFV
jgi:hypothetical protein